MDNMLESGKYGQISVKKLYCLIAALLYGSLLKVPTRKIYVLKVKTEL